MRIATLFTQISIAYNIHIIKRDEETKGHSNWSDNKSFSVLCSTVILPITECFTYENLTKQLITTQTYLKLIKTSKKLLEFFNGLAGDTSLFACTSISFFGNGSQ